MFSDISKELACEQSSKGTPLSSISQKDKLNREQVRSLLNNITPATFSRVSLRIMNFCQKSFSHINQMEDIAKLIFDKACHEHNESHLYAQLCKMLSDLNISNIEGDRSDQVGGRKKVDKTEGKETKSFRYFISFECQNLFDSGTEFVEHWEIENVVCLQEEYKKQMYSMTDIKVIGNIKFIGELFKVKLIHERCVHRCFRQLMGYHRANVQKIPIISKMDLVAAVTLLMVTGQYLDSAPARRWIDQYFDYLQMHARRLRDMRLMFMVQKLEELRGSGWASAKDKHENKAEINFEYLKDLFLSCRE